MTREGLCKSRSARPFPAFVAAWVLIAAIFYVAPVQGVIFLSTADPEHNATPPGGELAGSGWDLQGSWGAFLGTPIGAQYFITAKHFGGAVGGLFSLHGVAYDTVAFYDDPESDLRVWKIRGRFPAFAELYSRSDEVGKSLVVFGRGTQRGDEVFRSGLTGSALKGWRWGVADGRMRWGENQVGGIARQNLGAMTGGTASVLEPSESLQIPFDSRGGPNEAHLSAGDSGGGVFIQDGAAWKLAGINYVVDGPYNTTVDGAGFQAALFDEGGLFKGGEGKWTRIPNSIADIPSSFYATRISARLTWINGVLAQNPSRDGPILQSAQALDEPFTDEPDASVDAFARVVTLPEPAGVRFYRLVGVATLRIAGVTVQNGNLVLRYQ